MSKLTDVKGVIFDYGGTIDTNSRHWAEVLWSKYEEFQVPVDKASFREAYVHGERTLARVPLVKPEHNFHDVLRIKTDIQMKYLVEQGKLDGEEELKVELTKPTPEAGKAALAALERALADYREGLFDVLVTAPINKHTIQSDAFHFPGHTEYIEERVGEGQKALMILLKGDFRVALVTGHVPVRDIAGELTKELIMEKMEIFHRSLKKDFGIDNPRIAVFSLNPHAGDNGLLGTEEQEVIIPAMKEMIARGVQCFGPYPADGFMGSGNYTHFDGILAMYHDQGLAPFKALAMDEGVNFTAGLPIVRTSPAHGTAYDIAGKGIASEDSFRQAVYVAMDVFRNRAWEKEISARPLRKQYYEKRDDSDKLKLDSIEEE